MDSKFEKTTIVPLSLCDNTGRLSMYSIFTLFMDIATEHADELKISSNDLGEDLFWITVRTKVQILRRPKLSEKITISTWPEKPSRVRANRHYVISDSDGVAIQGKSEWTVVNTATGKLQRVSEVYPSGLEYVEDTPCDAPYPRISDDFTDCDTFATYTIRSTDIDLVGHMNNAAYIRAFIGAFSTKDLEESPITEIDIAYKAQSYEGETLTIKERATDTDTEYGMIKEDGTTATTIRIVR